MHIAIYRRPPPRIPERIVTNLGKIIDWYIEDYFSYIRVFWLFGPSSYLAQVSTRLIGVKRGSASTCAGRSQ
jgi:hypothetical protein